LLNLHRRSLIRRQDDIRRKRKQERKIRRIQLVADALRRDELTVYKPPKRASAVGFNPEQKTDTFGMGLIKGITLSPDVREHTGTAFPGIH
jgi:hypothetical protein